MDPIHGSGAMFHFESGSEDLPAQDHTDGSSKQKTARQKPANSSSTTSSRESESPQQQYRLLGGAPLDGENQSASDGSGDGNSDDEGRASLKGIASDIDSDPGSGGLPANATTQDRLPTGYRTAEGVLHGPDGSNAPIKAAAGGRRSEQDLKFLLAYREAARQEGISSAAASRALGKGAAYLQGIALRQGSGPEQTPPGWSVQTREAADGQPSRNILRSPGGSERPVDLKLPPNSGQLKDPQFHLNRYAEAVKKYNQDRPKDQQISLRSASRAIGAGQDWTRKRLNALAPPPEGQNSMPPGWSARTSEAADGQPSQTILRSPGGTQRPVNTRLGSKSKEWKDRGYHLNRYAQAVDDYNQSDAGRQNPLSHEGAGLAIGANGNWIANRLKSLGKLPAREAADPAQEKQPAPAPGRKRAGDEDANGPERRVRPRLSRNTASTTAQPKTPTATGSRPPAVAGNRPPEATGTTEAQIRARLQQGQSPSRIAEELRLDPSVASFAIHTQKQALDAEEAEQQAEARRAEESRAQPAISESSRNYILSSHELGLSAEEIAQELAEGQSDPPSLAQIQDVLAQPQGTPPSAAPSPSPSPAPHDVTDEERNDIRNWSAGQIEPGMMLQALRSRGSQITLDQIERIVGKAPQY